MSNILDESTLSDGELNRLSPMAIAQLQVTAKWTKFVGIVGVIGSLLVCIMLFVAASISEQLTTAYFPMLNPIILVGALVAGGVAMLVYAYASYLLNVYSNKLKKVIVSSDIADYNEALIIWNRYWLISLIISGIGIPIALLAFVGG